MKKSKDRDRDTVKFGRYQFPADELGKALARLLTDRRAVDIGYRRLRAELDREHEDAQAI